MSADSLQAFLEKMKVELDVSAAQKRLGYNLHTHTFDYSEDEFAAELIKEFKSKGIAVAGLEKEVVRLSALMTTQLAKGLDILATKAKDPLAARYMHVGTTLSFTFTTDVRTGLPPNKWAQGQADVFDKIKRSYHTPYLNLFYGIRDFLASAKGKGSRNSRKSFNKSYTTKRGKGRQLNKGKASHTTHDPGDGIIETMVREAFDKHKNLVKDRVTGKSLSEEELLKDLNKLGIDLEFMRDSFTGELTFSVGISGAGSNILEGAVMRKKLEDAKKRINEILGNTNPDEIYKGLKGSDSQFEVDRKTAIETIAASFKGRKGVKVTTTAGKPKTSRNTAETKVQTKGKKGKAVTFAAAALGAKSQTGKRKPRAPRMALKNILGILNAKLPQQVADNMGSPRLENQTGRFAQSVRAVDINETSSGFPSIGYTYARNPYGVYESTSGSRFAEADRDPRSLIDTSIRELVAQFGLGRLYTRRL